MLYSSLALLAEVGSVHAQEQSIPKQAQAFVYQQLSHLLTAGTELSISVRNTNTRLKREPCAAPVQFSPSRPLGLGSNTLKASCDYPRRWSQYIRTDVSLLRQVIASRRPLAKGDSLTLNDLYLTRIDQTKLKKGFFTRPDQIIGHVLNRSITTDQPITPKMLTSPILINKGDSVTIRAGNNGITVEVSGTALELGRRGQQIQIKNDRSGRTIKAQVIGPGIAKALR